MKYIVLLTVVSVLLLQQQQKQQVAASPVKVVELEKRNLARQQSTGTATTSIATATSGDDDDDDEDDDDDDYEPDLGDLVEDDDDDDDEDEDDDDDEQDDDDEEDDDKEEVDVKPQGQAAPVQGSDSSSSTTTTSEDDDNDADDDDEDDDDDEEGDDYLDRLFDDILGGDDDDDDDDDDGETSAVASPAANVQTVITSVSPPVGQQIEDLTPALIDGVELPLESENAIETIDPNVAPLPAENSNSQTEDIKIETTASNHKSNSISNKFNNLNSNHIPQALLNVSTLDELNKLNLFNTSIEVKGTTNSINHIKKNDDNEDDDDYDDDDVGGDVEEEIDEGVDELAGALSIDDVVADDDDDDADDDEADDDDDDDDDDLIGEDAIVARRAPRSVKYNNVIDTSNNVFQERNNQFIDAIFTRINRIVADNYDPFIVQLTAPSTSKLPLSKDFQSALGKDTTKITAGITNFKSKAKTPTLPTVAIKKLNNNKSTTTKTSIKKLKNTKSEPRLRKAEMNNQIYERTKINGNEQPQLPQQKQQEKLQEQQSKENQNEINKQIEDNLNGVPVLYKSDNSNTNNVITAEMHNTLQMADRNFNNDDVSAYSMALDKTERKKVTTQIKTTKPINKIQKKVQHVNDGSAGADTITLSTTNKPKMKSSTANISQTSHKTNKNKVFKAGGHLLKVADIQKTQGSLTGLASLKRVGNVKVITDPEYHNSTIKSKFTLGPLLLRVEKSFKRGGIENFKSATARTNEMIGRIKFAVENDRATLMSIKVQQPKQVEVESQDDHDNNREFVWHRTPKIAKLVNEKLKMVAETLFVPQGVEIVRL